MSASRALQPHAAINKVGSAAGLGEHEGLLQLQDQGNLIHVALGHCRTDLFMSMRPLIKMSCPTDSELTQPSKGLNLLTLRAPCKGGRSHLSTWHICCMLHQEGARCLATEGRQGMCPASGHLRERSWGARQRFQRSPLQKQTGLFSASELSAARHEALHLMEGA